MLKHGGGMPSFAETTTLLTRVAAVLPTANPSLDAVRQLATKVGIPPDRVTSATVAGISGGLLLKMWAGQCLATTLKLRTGQLPQIGGTDMVISKTRGWDLLDTAVFGKPAGPGRAVCLHIPFPPPPGETPTLLLEALARLAGRGAGIDGVLTSPLRLVNGRVTDSGTLKANIEQECVCKHVRGQHHAGKALGATLELRNAQHITTLAIHCEHADGRNTLLQCKPTALVQKQLDTLHELASQSFSQDSTTWATDPMVQLLKELDNLPAPSSLAKKRTA